MKTENKYVLYMHTRKSDGGIFYIGYGSYDRAYDFNSRGNWWKGIKKSYGVQVTILLDNLSLERALELEIKMIAFYGRQKPCLENLNYGCLINLTDGGDGGTGRIQTEEEKEKRKEYWTEERRESHRLKHAGEKGFLFGTSCYEIWKKKYDEETVIKKTEDLKEKRRVQMMTSNPHKNPEVKVKISNSLKDKPKTEEHKKNMSLSRIGKKHSEEQNRKQSIISTGSGNANSKLTEDDVIWIRKHYIPRHKEFGMGKLAKKFGVSFGTIDLIVRKITWTHIL